MTCDNSPEDVQVGVLGRRGEEKNELQDRCGCTQATGLDRERNKPVDSAVAPVEGGRVLSRRRQLWTNGICQWSFGHLGLGTVGGITYHMNHAGGDELRLRSGSCGQWLRFATMESGRTISTIAPPASQTVVRG